VNETDEDDGSLYDRAGAYAEPIIIADIICIGFRWMSNVVTCLEEAVGTTAGALNAVANVVGMHANHQRHQRRFAREVGHTIERLG